MLRTHKRAQTSRPTSPGTVFASPPPFARFSVPASASLHSPHSELPTPHFRMRFANYSTEGFYDEMFLPDGAPRHRCEALVSRIESLIDGDLQRRQRDAERMLMN